MLVWAKPEYSETLEKVSVLTTFAQSQLVSVLTTHKFLVSKNLGLDNFKIPGLTESPSQPLGQSRLDQPYSLEYLYLFLN